jgi:hypothetical protein
MTVSMTLALAFPIHAAAQRTDESYFRITPYLWMLGLDGTTAVLGDDADVDASFSDILDVLNIALSVNMEWNTQSNWFFVLDPMWADLEMDFAVPSPPAPLPITGKVEIELIIADALVGYSVNENFGVYAGARYYDQDITIVPDGAARRRLDRLPARCSRRRRTECQIALGRLDRRRGRWRFGLGMVRAICILENIREKRQHAPRPGLALLRRRLRFGLRRYPVQVGRCALGSSRRLVLGILIQSAVTGSYFERPAFRRPFLF